MIISSLNGGDVIGNGDNVVVVGIVGAVAVVLLMMVVGVVSTILGRIMIGEAIGGVSMVTLVILLLLLF